jgi:deazaflavin-dependent oxidoreductase (nitroreductase family)
MPFRVASKEQEMSTYPQPVRVPQVPVPPVRPSLLVRIAMRPMTRVLNPLIRKFAGRRHFRMAAEIRHVGRKSGRAYVTPAGARVSGNVAVIPLTFGNQSDWSMNVRAAGGCSIRVDGQDYAATEPELVDRADAGPLLRSAFGPMERAGFRLLGIKQYLRLRVVPEKSNQLSSSRGAPG